MAKHYHFIGIGGIGMGGLASLVLAKGGTVSGSDIKENMLTKRLEKEGAKVFIGHAAGNVTGADCAIFSSAISQDNPEIREAVARHIPILRRAELLAELMVNHTGITVAGAHGKTTTTSMIAHLLTQAGFQPTVAVGGIRNADYSNAALGQGQYFVAEADESDGSFLCYAPHYSVITNIDYEHLDYYHDWDNILESFRRFVGRTQPDGVVIACGDDPRLKGLLQESRTRFVSYGLGEGHDAVARDCQKGAGMECSSSFSCWFRDKDYGRVFLPLPGEHNILNALACICLGLELGIDFQVIRESLRSFQGVNRRFQILGQGRGITVVDDYGHHPTEITATLKAARGLNPKRLVTVFQPHRYTRTKFLMDDFVESLRGSDVLIVTDIYAASEQPLEGVTAQVLRERLQQAGCEQVVYLPKEEIAGYLLRHAQSGDWVLTQGAGDIYRVGEEFLAALQGTPEGIAASRQGRTE